MDSHKHGAVALTGDARAVLEELIEAMGDYDTGPEYRAEVKAHQEWWKAEVDRLYPAGSTRFSKRSLNACRAAAVAAVRSSVRDHRSSAAMLARILRSARLIGMALLPPDCPAE
jgi:TPP-dependent trihydroxycyclohexane-1,2-dione (THcHDO) dehydratase